jgi:hypothetical protein
MIVDDVVMLKNEVQRAAMSELLANDLESWSSLMGLMAVMVLPLTVDGKQHVEVETAPEVWRQIDQVSIVPPADEVVCAFGFNGHRAEWKFNLKLGAPRWRIVTRADAERPS